MTRLDLIVGYEVGCSFVDEFDLLKLSDALKAWEKIIARQRINYEIPNSVRVGTTPEGFKATYEIF